MSKIIFFIKRKMVHQIPEAVAAFIAFSIALCMIFTSFGLVDYFTRAIENTKIYNKDLRAFSVSADSSRTYSDIREIFKSNPHIAAIMVEEEEITEFIYQEQYSFTARACTEGTMPEILAGRGLDFTKCNEIILPDKMKMYDNESDTYVSINSEGLIGSTVKFSLYDEYDYPDVGKSFDVSVVGTYDSEKCMDKIYNAYVSVGAAHIFHSEDIDYNSDSLSLKIYTDSIDYNDSVVYLATENHLYFSSDSSSLAYINILRIVSVILAVILIGAATAAACYAVKMDFVKNVKDYYMMKVFGYSEEKLYSFVAVKYILISFASVLFSLPAVKIINSKISDLLYGKIQTGGLSLHMSFNSFLLGLIALYIIILLSIAKYFLDFLKVKVQDL